jgi:anti-sigma factor RsiW
MSLHPDLFRLIENRLSPAELRQARAHLATCAACHAELAGLSEAADCLGAVPRALGRLPFHAERSWPALWERVRHRPRAIPTWPMSLGMSLATLCLVLANVWPGAITGRYLPAPMEGVLAPRAAIVLALTPQPEGSILNPITATGTRQHSTSAPLPVATPVFGPTS